MLSLRDVRAIAAQVATRGAITVFAEAGDLLAAMSRNRYREDPYPLYERMRARGPIYRTPSRYYLATSHALVSQLLRDPDMRASRTTGKISGPPTNAAADTFIVFDGPDHARLRKIAAPAFRPKLMREIRTRIEATTNRLLDGLGTEFDLLKDFAAPLPIAVICDLLGIPEAERSRFARDGALIAQALDGLISPALLREFHGAMANLRDLFVRLMAERRADPRDDLLSVLAAAESDEQMTVDELIGTCRLLLIAGFETTVNLIGNGTALFAKYPAQWEILRSQPDLTPNAVEEILRYESSLQLTARYPVAPTQVAGLQLPKDADIMIMLGAANRDPAVFPNPHQFDITRKEADQHLAFGNGAHYCLGAPLARIEGDVAFRALAERLPKLRLAGPPVRNKSVQLRGYVSLPVTG